MVLMDMAVGCCPLLLQEADAVCYSARCLRQINETPKPDFTGQCCTLAPADAVLSLTRYHTTPDLFVQETSFTYFEHGRWTVNDKWTHVHSFFWKVI